MIVDDSSKHIRVIGTQNNRSSKNWWWYIIENIIIENPQRLIKWL
jgi:hypothetical protein